MAGNRTLIRGRQFPCVPTLGGVNSGDPCMLGGIPGVSMNGQNVINGVVSTTTPQTIDTLGVYNLFVRGRKAGANAAINSGDPIYYATGHTYTPGTDTPLTGDSSEAGAQLYGYALGIRPASQGGVVSIWYAGGACVASGADTAVDVRIGNI